MRRVMARGRAIRPTGQRRGGHYLRLRGRDDHHYLRRHQHNCRAAPLGIYVDVDADGGGCHDVYDAEGGRLVVDPLDGLFDPKLGSSELLSLSPLSGQF
ncbi:hypothetical protein BHE74_00015718 [Ensete ventricosum]|nr:hypothetical protein BHE74_00015718 [Ensete ventricosum]